MKPSKLLLILLVILFHKSSFSQGWNNYPYTPANSLISFPKDEGKHASEPIEWWYTTGHLTGSTTGTHYSFMLSYFKTSSTPSFRILNISNDDLGVFYGETLPVSYATLAADSLKIQANPVLRATEKWGNKLTSGGKAIPNQYTILAASSKGTLNLNYTSQKAPLIWADSGYFHQGAASYTYYYSQTSNTVSGSITVNGVTENVTGTSWVDRQYGSFNPYNNEDYEWFSLQLSNGMDIALTNIFTSASLIPETLNYKTLAAYVDGTTQYTTKDFTLERLKYLKTSDNVRCYAQKWRLTSAINNIDLIIDAPHPGYEVTLPFRFYEGPTTVTGTINGVAVTGKGFAELIHSYSNPVMTMSVQNPDTSPLVKWKLTNPDDGRPVKYNLEYSLDNVTFLPLAKMLSDTFYYFNNAPAAAYWLKLKAFSKDSTLFSYTTLEVPVKVTEILLPQYAINGTTAANRLQYLGRLQLDRLIPGSTYRYYTSASTNSSLNAKGNGATFFINKDSSSAGYIAGYSSNRDFNGATLIGSNEFTSGARYGTFTADNAGQYTGWFSFVPNSATDFTAGNNVYFYVHLNDGANGTLLTRSVRSTNTIKILAGDYTNAVPVTGNSHAPDEQFIFTYNNTSGSGRPLYGSWTENDGINPDFSTWYNSSVNGLASNWGTILPSGSTSANGIRQVAYYKPDGTLLYSETSNDGIWNGVNTASPAPGTTPLNISRTQTGTNGDFTVQNTTTLKSDLQVNGSLIINAGTLNAGSFQLNGNNLIMSAGVLKMAQNAAILPNFSGVSTFSGGTVEFAGNGNGVNAQTIKSLDYFNLASSSTGDRILGSGTIGIKNTFNPGSNQYNAAGSTIEYKGTNQAVAGFAYNNLVLSNGGIKILSGATKILPGGTVAISGVDFNLNNLSFKLKSDITGTARLAELSSGSTIQNGGQFVQERYISNRRRVRYLSSAVQNATISQWKDSTLIYGPVAGGFDSNGSNVSTVKHYNESSTAGIDKAWVSESSTSSLLGAGVGYYLFVGGNRNTVFPSSSDVTLSVKGIPNTGSLSLPVTYTLAGTQGWNLVGNPYPSQINWDSPNWTKTNIDNAVYIWDPITNSYYAYVGGTSVPSRTNPGIIASSQGFFVKANANTPVLNITEQVKTNATHTGNFRLEETSDLLRLKVSIDSLSDETALKWQKGATRDFDSQYDAYKLTNPSLNLFTAWKGTQYSIQSMPISSDTFSLPLIVTSPRKGNHLFQIIKEGNVNTTNLYLIDHFTRDITAIGPGLNYFFDLTLDPASTSANRFVIANYIADEIITSFGSISDKSKAGIYVFPNPVVGDLTISTQTNSDVIEWLNIFTSEGRLIISKTDLNSASLVLKETSELPKGIYLIKVKTRSGEYCHKFTKN